MPCTPRVGPRRRGDRQAGACAITGDLTPRPGRASPYARVDGAHADDAAAVSAGAIATTASWTAKTLRFLIALPFAAGSFHAPSSSGGHQAAVWVILAVIVVAGIAAALIALVPRFRRLASRRIRPHLLNIWANVKTIATERREYV